MKKFSLVCVFILLLSVFGQNLFAVDFDYGFDLETTDAIGLTYSYQRRLTPWVDIRFPELNGLRIAMQGSIYVRFNPKVDMFRPIADIDMFSIQTPKFPFCHGDVSFEFGRIQMMDVRGLIINQKVDGAAIHIAIPGLIMDFYGGYIGFQNYYTSSVMLSLDDYSEISKRSDKLYGLAARRAVFSWSTLFPEFIGRADVHGDMVAQIDMRKKIQELEFVEKKEVQELIDSAYVSAGINGPFYNSSKWYYNADFVVEAISRRTSKKSESYFAAFLNAGVQYFIKPNLQLSARVQYGTPNDIGISEYRPISYKAAGVFYEGSYNNIIKEDLTLKWKVSDNWLLDAAFYAFIAPRKITKFDRENFEKIYRYTEFSIGLTGVVANDLRVRTEFFYGMNNSKSYPKHNFSLRLKCNISL